MTRAALLGTLLLLAACGGETTTRAPDGGPTLGPTGLFKDGLLYAAIKARLAGSDIDAGTRVSVIVHGGFVTLRGVVADAATEKREVGLVRAMRGIKGVKDELRVRAHRLRAARTIEPAAAALGDVPGSRNVADRIAVKT